MVFHSVLKMQCPSWASAKPIAQFAHVLSAKKFDTAFAANFLAPAAKMLAKQDVSHLAGKSAEYLVAKFVDIFQNSTTGEMTESKTFKLGILGCTLINARFHLDSPLQIYPLTICCATWKRAPARVTRQYCSAVATHSTRSA